MVPDCFGEKWMDVCRKREWSNEWEELINEDCGCLVFLRVESEQIVPALDPITCAGYALKVTRRLEPDQRFPPRSY